MCPFLLNYWNGQSKTRPFSPQGVGRLPLEGVWKGAPAPTHHPWSSTAQPWGKPWEPQQNASAGASPTSRERKRKATKCPSGACPRPGTTATMAQTQPMDGAEEKQSQDIGKLYFFSLPPSLPLPFFYFYFPFSLLFLSSVAFAERWGLCKRAGRERAGWERKYILRHFHYSTWWELIKILNWK